MSVPAVEERREVARPLRVLETLIKKLLQEADDAAEEVRRPFYDKIAPILIEARDGHFQSDSRGFYAWATKKFGRNQATIRLYVARAGSLEDKSFKSNKEFRYTPKSHGGYGHTRPVAREWTAPVDAVAEQARREAFRLAQEEALTRTEEREAERKLAHRLIDIGYKVLAKELHPDKMHGDRDAMQRLNRVRDKLKHSI
jgi:hypothetical protein